MARNQEDRDKLYAEVRAYSIKQKSEAAKYREIVSRQKDADWAFAHRLREKKRRTQSPKRIAANERLSIHMKQVWEQKQREADLQLQLDLVPLEGSQSQPQ